MILIRMIRKALTLRSVLLNICGSFILAFGLYNIHSISPITEGGVIGANLLLEHFFGISPSISNIVLTAVCYLIGMKLLGSDFIVRSGVAVLSFSAFYALLECFPRVYPQIAGMPLAASLSGALFVGAGVGLCVRGGGAPTGDDALAMSLSKKSGRDIRIIYFVSDLTVLLLSLTYIKPLTIVFSVLTCILSGQIIGLFNKKKKNKNA